MAPSSPAMRSASSMTSADGPCQVFGIIHALVSKSVSMTATLFSQRNASRVLIRYVLIVSVAVLPNCANSSFVIRHGETVTDPRRLDGDHEVGLIETGGALHTGADTAIVVGGNSASIINDGSIITVGDYKDSVIATGGNVDVSSGGSIITLGHFAAGVVTYGSGARIVNTGSISTIGSGAYGIEASGIGANATIKNTGIVRTEGRQANGIHSTGTNAVITNDGGIRTEGVAAAGIFSRGASSRIINNGDINTSSMFSDGIVSGGGNANITNSGNISSEGNGVSAMGDRAEIINGGHIHTTGNFGNGIFSVRKSVSVLNNGSIISEGDNAEGIYLSGDNSTITNAGLVSATGNGSRAIQGGYGDQTLNIQSGSRIVGSIDLVSTANDRDNDIVNIYGSFGSAVLNFENTETINVLAPNAMRVDSTNTVIVIDPTGESVQSNTLSALANSVHGVIHRRIDGEILLEHSFLDVEYSKPVVVLWGQYFGQVGSRGRERQVLSYDYEHHGFIGGIEKVKSTSRMGLIAGVTQSNVYSVASSQDTESVFLGLYGHERFDEVDLMISVLAGIEEHDMMRSVLDNVRGYETAKGVKKSYFMSPSITLRGSYVLSPQLVFLPSATFTYAKGRYGDYLESGTANANLAIDERAVNVITTRLQLEVAKLLGEGQLSFRVGAHSRKTGGDDIAGNLAGTSFQFSASSEREVTGGFAGIEIWRRIKERFDIKADLEYGRFSGNEHYLDGQVALEYRF